MKRKLYVKIISILVFMLTHLAAQDQIKWQQSFDSPEIPAGWLVLDADESGSGLILVQQAVTMAGDTILPYSGQNFWTSNVQDANLAGVIDEWLISPRISVIYAGDSLYFRAGAVGDLFDDSLRIRISTLNNDPSHFKYQLANFKVDGPAGSWHRYGFDLSEFDSLDIYFAINYYIRDGGPGGRHSDFVWIDNPVISGDPSTLNNAPSFISLKEPSNESMLDINNNSIDFKWSASQDADGEDLTYTLSIVNVFPEMHFTLADTSLNLEWKDVLNKNTPYRWTVEVTDGKSKVAAIDTFSFELAEPVSIAGNEKVIPGDPVLFQNYPNPFNPFTHIEFQIPQSTFVTLNIFNMLGERVKSLISGHLNAGRHTYQFNGENMASGIYYYQLTAGHYKEVKKMLLIR